MAPLLLVTKSSPPSGGGLRKKSYPPPCRTSLNASTTPCSLDIASQIPRPNAARRIAAKTSRPNTTFNKILACKLPHVKFPAIPGLRSSIQNKAGTHQLALSALLGCPIAISAPSSDSYLQAHYGATDNGKALETAGALPVSDPRRLEKTNIAPHIDFLEIAGVCCLNPKLGLQAGLGVFCAAA